MESTELTIRSRRSLEKRSRVARVAPWIAGPLALSLLVTALVPGADTNSLQGAPLQPDPQAAERLSIDFERGVAMALYSTVAIQAYEGVRQDSGGVGSGVVIDGMGRVLTCAHVIQNSRNIKVIDSQGATWNARILGMDPQRDIAVIEPIPTRPTQDGGMDDSSGSTRRAIQFRNLAVQPLRAGEWMLALGHPGGPHFDKVPSASCGRLTSWGVRLPLELGSEVAGGLLQTDIPIISGNSGGPLVDRMGHLVGINNAVSLMDDRAFAIPWNAVSASVESWIANGGQGYLGANLRDLSNAERKGRTIEGGARITEIESSWHAVNSALAIGDIILALDGKPCASSYALGSMISESAPGSTQTLTLLRGNRVEQVRATIGKRYE